MSPSEAGKVRDAAFFITKKKTNATFLYILLLPENGAPLGVVSKFLVSGAKN